MVNQYRQFEGIFALLPLVIACNTSRIRRCVAIISLVDFSFRIEISFIYSETLINLKPNNVPCDWVSCTMMYLMSMYPLGFRIHEALFTLELNLEHVSVIPRTLSNVFCFDITKH